MKAKIIISAINFTEGGPLSILKECLEYVYIHLSNKYDIVALVHSRNAFEFKNITYLEFPQSKSSWFYRLYYEYYYFKRLSERLNQVLWLSLHDITPNVQAKYRAVYCHNPSPFYKFNIKLLSIEPRFAIFTLLYKYLYKINLKKNSYVVVQQDWIRKSFIDMFGVNNIIVAYPESKVSKKGDINPTDCNVFTFFYPAFPRIFKNFDVICKAAEILYNDGIQNISIMLTITGSETRYSRMIRDTYGHIPILKFIGIQSREMVDELYINADCLLFSSKLETWGLPITEFKKFNKPIILADLPYAHETIGLYDKAKFFEPDDSVTLANCMKRLIHKDLQFDSTSLNLPAHPFTTSWGQLMSLLLHIDVTNRTPEVECD